MTFSYDVLWKKLIELKKKKTELAEETGLNSKTMANMSKGKSISLDSIGRICVALDCRIEDVVEIIYDESDKRKLAEKAKNAKATDKPNDAEALDSSE